MMRGLGISYVVVILAYYGVAISGYAAFGGGVSSGACEFEERKRGEREGMVREGG
jgi:hypothetical protein